MGLENVVAGKTNHARLPACLPYELNHHCLGGMPVHRYATQSNNLPGFINPFGSSTRLIPRITSISAALRVLPR